MGDHTETVQIDYDENQISYEELLEIFWDNHCPESGTRGRQYASIVFYHNEDQKRLAEADREELEMASGKRIYTEVRPFEWFYLAEDYHQKYYLQLSRDIMKEIAGFYTNLEDFVHSPSAARLNGYIKGYGSIEQLEEELCSLGLSQAAAKRLKTIVDSY